jgi:hypothetical protein
VIKQLIVLSASANKLAKLKEQAEEYASLIMEELDPENLGYIEVRIRLNQTSLHTYTAAITMSEKDGDTCDCLFASCGSWRRFSSSATRT